MTAWRIADSRPASMKKSSKNLVRTAITSIIVRVASWLARSEPSSSAPVKATTPTARTNSAANGSSISGSSARLASARAAATRVAVTPTLDARSQVSSSVRAIGAFRIAGRGPPLLS